MDTQISIKLELLIGRTLSMESEIKSLKETIDQKISPDQREWLTDDDLEELYGFTKAIRNKLYSQKKLRRYKPSGKASHSLYSRSEVEQLIKDQIIFPKSKL